MIGCHDLTSLRACGRVELLKLCFEVLDFFPLMKSILIFFFDGSWMFDAFTFCGKLGS